MGLEEYTLSFFGFSRSKTPGKLLDFHTVICVAHSFGVFFSTLFCKSNVFYESKVYIFNVLFALSNRYGYVLTELFALFTITKRRFAIVRVLEEINEIDAVGLKGYRIKKPNYRNVLYFHFIHGLASWIYPCYCLFTNYTNYSPCVYGGIIVDYQIFMITNFVAVLTVKLKCLFVGLGENIRRSKESRKYLRPEIGSFMSLHTTLCELVDNVNECFAEIHLVVTTLEFVIVVDTIQYMYVGLFFYDCLFWCIKYATTFFMRMYFCSKLCEEADKTGSCLQELLVDNDDPQVREEIEIFSLQLLHRKVQFDACGFFKLDFGLLNSMIGAVTTYIVILIQFQATGAKNSCIPTNTSKTD